MHQQQPPQHPKLRQCIVTGLNGSHTLLAEQPDTYVGSLDHWYVVGSVADGESDFV